MKIGMFELNSIKTTSFFHVLEKDKPIVVVKNYLLLSKIGCQTSCYYHRKKASKLPACARAKGNIHLFSLEL